MRFCSQRPLGAPSTKPKRKERIRRYFHHKIDTTDNPISDGFVRVDARLEQLNVGVREQPQSFDAWKDLIDYQPYLYKTQGEEEKIKALHNKQLAIIDRALELNANRLQYRLCRLNLRTRSRLFDRETILNEWTALIKDCLKSSDDRTINETWFSYIQYLTNHVDLFSIDKLDTVFAQYYSTYIYHMQTRSEKERRYLLNHMIGKWKIEKSFHCSLDFDEHRKYKYLEGDFFSFCVGVTGDKNEGKKEDHCTLPASCEQSAPK